MQLGPTLGRFPSLRFPYLGNHRPRWVARVYRLAKDQHGSCLSQVPPEDELCVCRNISGEGLDPTQMENIQIAPPTDAQRTFRGDFWDLSPPTKICEVARRSTKNTKLAYSFRSLQPWHLFPNSVDTEIWHCHLQSAIRAHVTKKMWNIQTAEVIYENNTCFCAHAVNINCSLRHQLINDEKGAHDCTLAYTRKEEQHVTQLLRSKSTSLLCLRWCN